MSILVTGGAGYIGSHTIHCLIENGYSVVAIDNLQTGHLQAVHPAAKFYRGDIRSLHFLSDVFENEGIEAVFHFAACSQVGESMVDPLKYYEVNVSGTKVLLEAMRRHGIKFFIFSSTAAVYGESDIQPIRESAALNPSSPYGDTKLAVEKMIHWWGQAFDAKYVSLRYFNAGGAKQTGEIGENHSPETHLIPIILQTALGKKEYVTIFGDEYSTKDGTCIRDYIHVEDLAVAHVKAYEYLLNGGDSDVFNLGNSAGYSVKEVIEAANKIIGKQINVRIGPKRAGDPAELIASSQKASHILGWKPQKSSIDQIIKDAWNWHSRHPEGYKY